MQIEITPNAGHGVPFLLPEELALDDSRLSVDLPGVVIPGRHGRRPYGMDRRLEPRSVTASGSILGLNPQDAENLAEIIRGQLLGRGELWLRRFQGSGRFLRVQTQEVSHDYHRGHFQGSMFTLNIRFQADAPFWYADAYQSVEQVIAASPTSWTLNQPGTSELQDPVIRIFCDAAAAGPLINPSLTNTTTGRTVAVTGSVQPGQALVIRSHPMVAYVGAVTLDQILTIWGVLSAMDYADAEPAAAANVLGSMSPAWLVDGWTIQPGDNQIQYSDDATSSHQGAVQIGWRPRYY